MRSRAIVPAVVLLLLSPFVLAQDAQKTSTPDSTPAASTDSNAPAASQDSGAPPAITDSAPPAAPSSNTSDKDKNKNVKPGSKDDVNAIGNRNMGGKGLGNWYSIEHEIRMGKQYAMQVEQSVRLVQDPVVNEYVNRIGQNLVRNSDAKVPFTIKVIDDDSINAFALPGGFFYVNSGLVLAADNESEMAGVMAHEISHVAARHATRQMTRAQLANFASIPLIFIGGGIGYAVSSAASLALPLTFLSFSRGFEAEADYLGVEYMYKTGYDPESFIAFFEKIQAKEKKKPGSLAKAFATHPQTPERIAKSQEEINHILPPRPEYVVDTSEFQQVKARLAAIENRRKLTDDKDKSRPTLRRTAGDNRPKDTGSGDSSDSSNKQDDDRPTLKRRDQ
ncbi:MAG TPA: M48 family metallopeptidase [Terriglobales bacterium]|nr:M48 family metallopeptidase [Terriglobales bacterium]